jgi:hypothetical protein
MLPRLQFVVAAVFIAALPWIVFSSGLLPDFARSSIAEYSRQGSSAELAVSDPRDVRQMYLMSYVRRSRELERLREMASAPLSVWMAAPDGKSDLAAEDLFNRPAVVTASNLAALPPTIPASAAAEVAPTPVEAAPETRAPEAAAPKTPFRLPDLSQAMIPPEPTPLPNAEAAPARQAMLDAVRVSEPTASGRAGFVPPLPRARPAKASVRHVRHPRAAMAQLPLPPPPGLFNGPPAPPTLTNNFQQHYGEPQ